MTKLLAIHLNRDHLTMPWLKEQSLRTTHREGFSHNSQLYSNVPHATLPSTQPQCHKHHDGANRYLFLFPLWYDLAAKYRSSIIPRSLPSRLLVVRSCDGVLHGAWRYRGTAVRKGKMSSWHMGVLLTPLDRFSKSITRGSLAAVHLVSRFTARI